MKTLEFSGLRHYLRHYHIQKPLNLAACAIMRHYCAIIRSQYAHKRQPLCGACAPALRRMGYGGKARKPISMRKAYSRISALLRFSPVPRDVFCGLFFGWFLRRNLPAELGIKMSFKMSPELLHKLAELIEEDSVLSLDEICGDLPRLARIRKWGFVPTPAQARKAFEQLEAAAQVVISRNGYIRPADRMRRVVFAKGTRIGPAKAFKFYNRRAGPWRGRPARKG